MIKLTIMTCITKIIIVSFEYRETSPDSLFPHYRAVINYDMQSTIINPAYLPLTKGYYINFSGSNPYTLEDIASTSIKIGCQLSQTGIQIAWHRFGIKEYGENILEGNVGYMPIKYIALGIGLSYFNLAINTKELYLNYHLFDVRCSILCMPCKWIHLAYHQANIISLFVHNKRDLLYPAWSVGAALHPLPGLSIIWNITETAHGLSNTFSLSANVLQYLSIKIGYGKETETYAAATTIAYKYISLSYGIKFHPHLGYTHSAGLTLCTSGLAFTSFKYKEKPLKKEIFTSREKININTCTYKDLLTIPIIDKKFARRIITYRKTIGPLSIRSLSEIGFSSTDISLLKKYCTGFKDRADNKYSYKTKKNLRKRQKFLFKSLTAQGLNAYAALQLAKLSTQGDQKKIITFIKNLPDLNNDQKSEIRKICIP